MEDVTQRPYSTIKTNSLERSRHKAPTSPTKPDPGLAKYVTSSVASSGYWEDCDSLGTSEYDISGSLLTNDNHPPSPNRSSRTEIQSALSLPNDTSLTDLRNKLPDDYSKPSGIRNSNSQELDHKSTMSDYVGFGRQNSKPDLNLTLKRQKNVNQSPSPYDFSLSTSTFWDDPEQFEWDVQVERKPVYTSHKRTIIRPKRKRLLHKSFSIDASSSDDEDEDDDEEEGGKNKKGPVGEPKTKFEAALRKAESTQRQQALNSERLMPDWGSPIQIRPANKAKRTCNVAKSLDPEIYMQCDESHSKISESPTQSKSTDLCSEMEEWLSTRRSSLYHKKTSDYPILQIFFLNDSQQDLTVPVTESTTSITNTTQSPKLPETTSMSGQQSPVYADQNSPQLRRQETLEEEEDSNPKSPATRPQSQKLVYRPPLYRNFSLLTTFEISNSLVALLKGTDFYYKKLLDLCRQDCSSAQSVVLLQNMIQKHKVFETESRVALAQVPKMANMQLEVERLKIQPITPPVAKLVSRLEFFIENVKWVTMTLGRAFVVPDPIFVQVCAPPPDRPILFAEYEQTNEQVTMEVERTVIRSLKFGGIVQELENLKIDTRKSIKLESAMLDQYNVSQLQVIANDMLKTITSLNSTLMQQLMERDELHLEQGGKIADMEDIRSWVKDLCIQAQNPLSRRQFLQNLLAANYPKLQASKAQDSQQPQTKTKWVMSLFRHKSVISSMS